MSLIIKDNDNHLIKKPISAESTDNNISQNIINDDVVTMPTVSHPSQAIYGSTITLTGSGSLTAFKDNGAIIDTYEWVLPDGSIVESNTISYTMPDSNHIGETVTIKCRARDTLNNYSRYQIISIIVSGNREPIVDSVTWDNNDHYEQGSYILTIAAHDPDVGDTITYTVSCDDTNVTVIQDVTNSNVFHITYPEYTNDVTVTYTITVTDNTSLSTSIILTQTVHNINHLPIIDNTFWDDDTHYENGSYILTINAHDPDVGDTLSYAVTCSDTNVTVTQDNTNPNQFHITYPHYNFNTSVTYTITVADNHGDFTITSIGQSVIISSGDRGIFAGGQTTDYLNTMDYITISTLGNALDFGDLLMKRRLLGATSNGTNDRGVFAGGSNNNYLNTIDYIAISTLSNASYFGDLDISRSSLAATSNDTNDRGVFSGGHNGIVLYNAIEYINITTLYIISYFGDLTLSRCGLGATSNGTNNRGVFIGGSDTNGIQYNTIDYITISTLGNALDFGDIVLKDSDLAATSNGTNDRGVFSNYYNFNLINTINYITISTLGDAQNFGDLTVNRYGLGATSNGTNDRGVFGGGNFNTIDYITISTLGDAQDFGDLTVNRYGLAATSNG